MEKRQQTIEKENINSPLEMLMVDMAMMAYSGYVRTAKRIGDLQAIVDQYLFGLDHFEKVYERKYQEVNGARATAPRLKAEDYFDPILNKHIPALERYQKMFMRGVKGLRDYKRSQTLITQKQLQINIAKNQINVQKQDDK